MAVGVGLMFGAGSMGNCSNPFCGVTNSALTQPSEPKSGYAMASHLLSALRPKISNTKSRERLPSVSALDAGPARTRKLAVVRYAANEIGVGDGVGDGPRVGFKVGVRVGICVARAVGVWVGTRVGRGVLVAASAIFSSAEGAGALLNCAAYSRVKSKYILPYVTLGSIIEPSTHSLEWVT